jgi:hypothetical protein
MSRERWRREDVASLISLETDVLDDESGGLRDMPQSTACFMRC